MLYKWRNKNSYKSYCLLFPLQNQTEGHSEHKIELHLEMYVSQSRKPQTMYSILTIDELDNTFIMIYANQDVVLAMNDNIVGGLL